MFYWIKTHWIVKKIFSKYVWDITDDSKKVYLTFDDGPTPDVTEWVLLNLEKYNAKATFFCIGHNIEKHPDIFIQLVGQGHSIGNHTYNHVNGWKTSTNAYLDNVLRCELAINEAFKIQNGEIENENQQSAISNQLSAISSRKSKIKNQQSAITNLFRPPYGKIKKSQAEALRKKGYKIIMWDVLSADFDTSISKEKCLENVLKNVQSGSIIIFHDSQKAFPNLEYALPKTLQYLQEKGFVCETIR